MRKTEEFSSVFLIFSKKVKHFCKKSDYIGDKRWERKCFYEKI